MYDDFATSLAWKEGLTGRFLIHQRILGLFKGITRCFLAVENDLDRSVSLTVDRTLAYFEGLRVAFSGVHGRGVDPVTGPKQGILIDPFLAYPEWRARAYAVATANKTYYTLSEDDHGRSVASHHTIRDVKKAVNVSAAVYEAIASVLGLDDWKRVLLSEEDRTAARVMHMAQHFPAVLDMRFDREAMLGMFGGLVPSNPISEDDIARREEVIKNDSDHFLQCEEQVH